MNTLRSLIFTAWLYLSMPIIAIGLSPVLLAPHRYVQGVCKLWAKIVLFGLRWIAGVKVEVRGLEHAPSGAALIASKHQGMLDIVALLAVLPDACFVMKKELRVAARRSFFWRSARARKARGSSGAGVSARLAAVGAGSGSGGVAGVAAAAVGSGVRVSSSGSSGVARQTSPHDWQRTLRPSGPMASSRMK